MHILLMDVGKLIMLLFWSTKEITSLNGNIPGNIYMLNKNW